MNNPPNLYCRAWQYLFEIVTVANISPILIVAGASGLSSAQSAMLIQSAMIIAGIGTLIQPIVAASVVTSIGFSLLSVGASSFGGGSSFPYYSD